MLLVFLAGCTGALAGEGEEEDGARLGVGDVHDDALSRLGSVHPGVGRRHPHAIGGPHNILMLLEDHIVRTQTMRGSPFIKPFEKEIREWEERMIRIQETIDEWLKVRSF